MSRNRRVLILPLVFVITAFSTFFFYGAYKKMVRYFYRVFSHNKIHLVGKNVYMFPSDYAVLSFGVLCVVFAALLYRHTLKQRVYRTVLAVVIFFLSTAIGSYINARMLLGAGAGENFDSVTMNYNVPPYDNIFVLSGLSVIALFMLSALVRLLPVFSGTPVGGAVVAPVKAKRPVAPVKPPVKKPVKSKAKKKKK